MARGPRELDRGRGRRRRRMRVQVTHTRGLIAAAIAGGSVALCAPLAHAGIDETTASYLFNYYSDVDGVAVFGHYVTTGLRLENAVNLNFQWVPDRVVFPAIEAPP